MVCRTTFYCAGRSARLERQCPLLPSAAVRGTVWTLSGSAQSYWRRGSADQSTGPVMSIVWRRCTTTNSTVFSIAFCKCGSSSVHSGRQTRGLTQSDAMQSVIHVASSAPMPRRTAEQHPPCSCRSRASPPPPPRLHGTPSIVPIDNCIIESQLISGATRWRPTNPILDSCGAL